MPPLPPLLRFLTFNLRTSHALGDGPNLWRERREFVLETILENDPDIAALQEMSPAMWEDLESGLAPWTIVKGWAETGPKMNGNGLLVRKGLFQVRATGQFWLSDTPFVPQSVTFPHDWGPRIVLWAQVEGPAPYGSFYAAATHFDTNPASSLPASRVALEQLDRLPGNSPLWLMGDFNCAGGCPAWEHFRQGGFQDAWRQTGQGEEDVFTFHKFTGKDLSGYGRIDWILHRGPWKAQACGLDRRNRDGFYPSDHFPVRAEYSLRG